MKNVFFRLTRSLSLKEVAHPIYRWPPTHQILEEEIRSSHSAFRGEMVVRVGIFLHQVSLIIYTPYPFNELRRFISIFLCKFLVSAFATPFFLVRLLVLKSFLLLIVYSEAFL